MKLLWVPTLKFESPVVSCLANVFRGIFNMRFRAGTTARVEFGSREYRESDVSA